MIILLLILLLLVVLYVLILFYAAGLFRRGGIAAPGTHNLPVTVVVTMHNEERNVRACLDCLLNQDYPHHLLEIILATDRCQDRTEQIINEYLPANPLLRLISINRPANDFAPKKFAIDRAVRSAAGEIILLTDADGRPGPHWITRMVSVFNDEVGLVLGYAPYRTDAARVSFLRNLLALEYFSHAAVAAASVQADYPLTCVGTNLAYRKHIYEKLNGFGRFKMYRSGDDDLFLQRVREETNWKIRYAADRDAHVLNDPPADFGQFYQQRLRYASKGFLYPFRITLVLIGLFLMNLLLLLSPLFLFHFEHGLMILVVILVSKIISEYNFLTAAAQHLHDHRYLKLIPLASLLHVPYVVFFGLMGQLQKYKWGEK